MTNLLTLRQVPECEKARVFRVFWKARRPGRTSFQENVSINLRFKPVSMSNILRVEVSFRGLRAEGAKQQAARRFLDLRGQRQKEETKMDSKRWLAVGRPLSLSKKIRPLLRMSVV